ncbi:MAG: alpha-glucosidase, partial [Clostridia bacterium]|nr:alpha-glucosidase [Clostridia bacterium]
LFFNNHDNPKMISKVNPQEKFAPALAKLLAVIQFTLKGTPFVFQGDEMGLTNHHFASIEEITDVESKGAYQEYLKTMSEEAAFRKVLAGTREHARLMIPWEELEQHKEIHSFYERMIALRKAYKTLIYGAFIPVSDKKNRWTYKREDDEAVFLIDCNLSEYTIKRKPISKEYQCIMNTYGDRDGNEKEMQPYEAVVYRSIVEEK